MGVGPNLPTTKRGKNIIMAQGQTENELGLGLNPFEKGLPGSDVEPKPLKP